MSKQCALGLAHDLCGRITLFKGIYLNLLYTIVMLYMAMWYFNKCGICFFDIPYRCCWKREEQHKLHEQLSWSNVILGEIRRWKEGKKALIFLSAFSILSGERPVRILKLILNDFPWFWIKRLCPKIIRLATTEFSQMTFKTTSVVLKDNGLVVDLAVMD